MHIIHAQLHFIFCNNGGKYPISHTILVRETNRKINRLLQDLKEFYRYINISPPRSPISVHTLIEEMALSSQS